MVRREADVWISAGTPRRGEGGSVSAGLPGTGGDAGAATPRIHGRYGAGTYNYIVHTYTHAAAGASPRIFEWGGGGRIVGRVANLPQNTLTIGKTQDFGHFILESGGSTPPPVFKNAGVRTPRRRRPCTHAMCRYTHILNAFAHTGTAVMVA